MAGEIVYADLNIPPETPSSRTFHPSQQSYASQSPSWQKITLCIACIGNVILLAALVALANSSCQVCPAYWHLHMSKCYWWHSNNSIKNWNDSRDDCAARDARLLIIQDKDMLNFITKITQEKHYSYWIGLSLSLPEKKWMWTTGSQMDRNITQEPNHDEGQYCGAIRNSKIISDICSVEFRWICQKDTVLI
nr:PREDICTED: killer cell lectin-like receptor subfamily B member 1B allele C isoform X3 [Anolis carolinensis]|eukprot:XP_008118310.1 PREDICTED: killer cell lectin-like receptor subfamily B member 1B allele C isoform X3 [Anolis carolinensis]